jgi:glycosyltransferase involved in cell wall biosynthesis
VTPSLTALKTSGLIVPEVFSAAVARALPAVFATTPGPRIALFHDAIALKFPELTPAKTVARFPAYLVELLAFDGIAAVSEDSRASLVDYWRWLGTANPPPVHAIPLGIDLPGASGSPSSALGSQRPPTILSVGSIEGRKNHLALLDACERLWLAGEKFSLHLIGLAHPQTGAAALARLHALQAAGRPLRYDGPVSDAAVAAAYAACAFTVYPSLIEGFGLPVIESLAHGKPCLCSARGALGESARGGGCLALESVNAEALADAIARMLRSPDGLAALATAARARRFKTWHDYASELIGWMSGLPRR